MVGWYGGPPLHSCVAMIPQDLKVMAATGIRPTRQISSGLQRPAAVEKKLAAAQARGSCWWRLH